MEQNETDRALLSVADAARHLQRSTEQVRRYLREGRLSGRRIGGQWFIERAALNTFSGTGRKEERFTLRLKPAARTHPLDDIIGIGHGPGSNLSEGKTAYRLAGTRRRQPR